MTNLKPGAFRVWDNVEQRYVDPDSSKQSFQTDQSGNLTKWVDYGLEGYQPHEGLEERYVVERWTGRHDRDANPIYAGDKSILDEQEMVVYDDGSSFVFTKFNENKKPIGDPVLFSHLWTHNLKITGTIHGEVQA